MFTKENFTCKQIFPFSSSSFAPVTSQCPGLSCGPLHSCDVSTNFNNLFVRTGTGGPVGNTLESTTTTASCFALTGFPEIDMLNAENIPDFCENSEAPSAQFDCTMKAFETLENKSRRWRTVLDSCFVTWSWAPVTMKTTSFRSLQLGLYLTRAVLTWENLLLCIASKYRTSAMSSDPRQNCTSSSILFLRIVGRFDKCWRWIANLLHFMPSRYNRIPVTGRFLDVTLAVLTKSLGPIKFNCRAGDEPAPALLVAAARGRSLWIGAQILCDWKSRKYCKSCNGGLSAKSH